MFVTDRDGKVQGPFVQKHWRQDWRYEDSFAYLERVDGQAMFVPLFEYADRLDGGEPYEAAAAADVIRGTFARYVH